jgi:hypothetical protein
MDDHVAALESLLPPPPRPQFVPSARDWELCERRLGVALPSDVKAFFRVYGQGEICDLITVCGPGRVGELLPIDRLAEVVGSILREMRAYGVGPALAAFPEPAGVLPWGVTPSGDTLAWITEPRLDPDRWTTIIFDTSLEDVTSFDGSMSGLLESLLDGRFVIPFFPGGWPGPDLTFAPSVVRPQAETEDLNSLRLIFAPQGNWQAAELHALTIGDRVPGAYPGCLVRLRSGVHVGIRRPSSVGPAALEIQYVDGLSEKVLGDK